MATDVTVILDDQPGELARLGEVAGAARVNLDGFAAFTGEGKGVVHVLVADESLGALRDALAAAGMGVADEREVFVVNVAKHLGPAGIFLLEAVSEPSRRVSPPGRWRAITRRYRVETTCGARDYCVTQHHLPAVSLVTIENSYMPLSGAPMAAAEVAVINDRLGSNVGWLNPAAYATAFDPGADGVLHTAGFFTGIDRFWEGQSSPALCDLQR